MAKNDGFTADLAAYLDGAFETLDEGIAVYDSDEKLVYCNQLHRQYLGPLAHMSVPGANWRACMHAAVALGVDPAIFHPGATGKDFEAEADHLRAKGVRREAEVCTDGRSFEIAYTPTKGGGFVLRRKDITERARAEASAEDYASLLKSVLDANPIPVVMARLSDSRVVWHSPAAVAIIGDATYTRERFCNPQDRDAYVTKLETSGQVEDFRTMMRMQDGRMKSVGLSGMLTEFEGETCVVSSITDLTEVLDREALLRKVIEACPAPVLMNRADSGEILYRSPELTALFGEGANAAEFYANPEDRRGFVEAIRRDGSVSEYRARMKNARGAPFWVALSGRLTEWNGEEVLVTFTRDLSTQLSMEEELDRQREVTFQSEKMSALGGLLAGVAHELNNPLSIVVGHAMMLQEENLSDATRRQIEKISTAAERCAGIVKTFLALARQDPARVERLDLNEVVKIAADVARYGEEARSVAMQLDLDEDVPAIEGDADQLTQLVINLVINAEQAIVASGSGDRVTLRTRHVADKAVLWVEDNGPGVPADVRKRVFEPFFTTKGVGQGTGLGLSMCHQIASAHRGTIRLEEVEGIKKGGGARFVLELPATSDGKVRQSLSAPAVNEVNSARRILIIDDEIDVAELNAEVLNRSGYITTAVSNAEEGLALMAAAHFDVVLSDLNMPGIDGRSFFEALRRDFPEQLDAVGFITGDTLGKASQTFLAEAGRPYLEKPVSPKELRAFVACLDQKGHQ